MQSPYLTIPEVAAQLRVSGASVRRWCLDGRLPCVRAGRAFRIRQEDVDAFLTTPQPQEASA